VTAVSGSAATDVLRYSDFVYLVTLW